MTLPEAHTTRGREATERLLNEPRRALVAMDFDGTLAPIVPRPEDARADPQVRDVLQRLSTYVGQLAVVTGRPAQLAVEYGGFADVDNLVVLGHYGLERWFDGSLSAPGVPPGAELVRQRLPMVLEEAGAHDGTAVEDKGQAVAVHVRGAADPRAALAALTEPLHRLADEAGLVVEPGRMVLELRPPGVDKGGAVRTLTTAMAETAPLSAVVFAGDDLGDLAAFDEVDRLRAEGVPGLLICSGSDEVPALADRADLVVDGPAGMLHWLEALAELLERPEQPAAAADQSSEDT